MPGLMKSIVLGCILTTPLAILSAGTAHAKSVCLEIDGSSYVISALPKSTKPKVIAGTTNFLAIPLVGSGFVDGTGNRIIGLTAMFSTSGGHPVGTLRIVIPPDVLVGTYGRSFHGDGAITEDAGVATIVECP